MGEVLRNVENAVKEIAHPHGAAVRSTDPRIEHVVVLALENRSFDHMLGYLKAEDPRIEGISEATAFNYPNPINTENPIYASDDAPYVPDVDPMPSHDFHDVLLQVFSDLKVPDPLPELTNLGFVYDYAKVSQDPDRAGRVMRCFAPGKLPALHQLAREFAICDHWFSSLPGPTWPNRFFMHSGTSGGFVDNAVRDYGMNTIFQNLSAKGVGWRVYYHDFPQSLALRHQRQYLRTNYEKFEDAFKRDCGQNRLPQYSFIEPRYFNEGANRANDQHPIHGVVLGDHLIADVYEAMRNSDGWGTSLLLIVWDEHGGFYDHLRPPKADPPDEYKAPEFDFTRLGVRVPAVIVSPFIQQNTVYTEQFDHASICATLRKLFSLQEPLSARDAAANTFDLVLNLSERRAHTPEKLDRVDLTQVPQPDSDGVPPSELHTSLVTLAEKLVGVQDRNPYSEREAAQRANAAFQKYFEQQTAG